MLEDEVLFIGVCVCVDVFVSSVFIDLWNGLVVLSLFDVGCWYVWVVLYDGWNDVFELFGNCIIGVCVVYYVIMLLGWDGMLFMGVK